MSISLIAIGFVASLACNVALWMMKKDAQAEANQWRALYEFERLQFREFAANSIYRDPKTGRYVKKWSK